MRRILTTACIVSLSLLAGCNTVRGTVNGAGEDVQSVGNAMNPPHHRVVHRTTTVTTSQLTNSLGGATTAPIQRNGDAIPEESY